MAVNEDPEDSGSDIDLFIPEVYGFFRGATLSFWDKSVLIVKQTWKSIHSDLMTQFILLATFVNSLMKAKLGTIVYLWFTKWSIPADQEKVYDTDLTGDESWARYQLQQLIGFIISLTLIPLYGIYHDKIASGHELMITFGLRAIGCLAFFMCDSPNGNLVIWTVVSIKIAASLQSTVIDSLYAKRLQGDVRGSMNGVKSVVSNLGHLTFVCFSLALVDYYDSIHKSMVLVSAFDGMIFFMVFNVIIFAGFEYDTYFGKLAREKGKQSTEKLNNDKKKFEQGNLVELEVEEDAPAK